MNNNNDESMMNYLANEIAKTYMQGKVGSMEEFAATYMTMYEIALKEVKSRQSSQEKRYGSLEAALESLTEDTNNYRFR